MTTSPYAYSVYGLAVSSDLELPGLRPASGRGAPLRIDGAEGALPPAPAAAPDFHGGFESFWRLDEDDWLLRYAGDEPEIRPWSIEAEGGGSRLTVRWCDLEQLHDIPSLVAGPGLALALHMQCAFLLHASAVETGGRAILLIGDSGAGKSTTAAALVRREFRLVSDDISVIDMDRATVAVRAGPSRLRIYEDSARAAGWAESLPLLFRHPVFDDKRYIELDANDGCRDLTPVAAICVLQQRGAATGAAAIELLSPRRALGALLSNIYCARFLDATGAAEARRRCAMIAALVPTLAVHRPDDLTALSDLADAIAAHVANLA